MLRTFCYFLVLINPVFSTAQTLLRANDLQKDYSILRQIYEQWHPGLYQYVPRAQLDRQFALCRRAFNHDQSLAEAFLTVAKLTASIQCGHSQANFWNQDSTIRHALFDKATCLPVYTQLIGQRLLVTHSVDPTLPPKWEIRQINGQPVSLIIPQLLPYVRADGANNGKRLALLSITGKAFECFDIFYSLLFPLPRPCFDLQIYNPKTGQTQYVQVAALTRQERKRLMDQQYPQTRLPMAQLTWLNHQTPVLQINSMVDYNTSFDLKTFIDQAFQTIQQKKAPFLVIDIRQLEGGNDQYGKQIAAYLLTKPVTIQHQQTTWAYVRIDSSLSRYIINGSWADGWKYRSANDFTRTEAGQYRTKGANRPDTLWPAAHPFQGKTFLLTGPMNSSAGFLLAQVVQQHQLATLVGQTTGGNQKGITAGAVFFVRLPYSGIEVDVPLIGTGYDVARHLPDAGIQPDWPVEPTVEDWISSTDRPLHVILQRTKQLK